MGGVIDHLVYATPDVDATVGELSGRLGVRAAPGGRHPTLGTRNALLALDNGAYLGIIGVDDDGPPADGPRPFGLDRIAGPRLATWAARVKGIDGRIAAARAAGYDPGPPGAMSRRRPDGVELQWRLTPPSAEAVELVPFLIDWSPETPHPSTTSPPGCRLVHFRGEHPEPDAVGAALAALALDLAVTPATALALVAILEGPAGRMELR